MKLIGMLDSPYVRRVAISMKLMGIDFEHQSLSVFRTFDQFRAINPVVKAPTLVCDDGLVLMDSTLILDYLEGRAIPDKRLMPAEGMSRREALRLHGLALAACEKGVQVVYEKQQRPEEKRHMPWLDRVVGQANADAAGLIRCVHSVCGPAGISIGHWLRPQCAPCSFSSCELFCYLLLPTIVFWRFVR
jgi:glutathione S-transferase